MVWQYPDWTCWLAAPPNPVSCLLPQLHPIVLLGAPCHPPPKVMADLSWDQQYVYKMVHASEAGSVPHSLQIMVIAHRVAQLGLSQSGALATRHCDYVAL